MNRLITKDKYGWYNPVDHNAVCDKLYKLEELEEKLGCPLEVVFKAIMKGCYILKDNGELEPLHFQDINIGFETFEEFNEDTQEFEIVDVCLCIGCCYEYSKLKDYKKTWWLKEDKTE